jgi:hypothetical protein
MPPLFSLTHLSLYLSLLLALCLPETVSLRFRLNGGSEEGFIRNAFSPSCSPWLSLQTINLSLQLALCLPETASLSLSTEWWLRSKLPMECIRLRPPRRIIVASRIQVGQNPGLRYDRSTLAMVFRCSGLSSTELRCWPKLTHQC